MDLDNVSLALTCIAAVFLLGIAGERLSTLTGIPDVALLVLAGLVLGPISGILEPADLLSVAPYFGAFALVVVLVDGGLGVRSGELSSAVGRPSALAVLAFAVSVAFIAPIAMLFAWFELLPPEWGWAESLLLGCILGGPSYIVVASTLRRSGLPPKLVDFLSAESAVADVLAVVCAVACLHLAQTGSTDAASAAAALARSLGIGVGAGLVVGFTAVLAVGKLAGREHAYPLLLGVLLLLYVLVHELGGSAPLALVAAAIIVGNAKEASKILGQEREASPDRRLADTHAQITFIVKSFFFTFVGAMLSAKWGLIIFGMFLAVVLLLARIGPSMLALVKSGFEPRERALVLASVPRGMAAGVLAMIPWETGVRGTKDMPAIVFACIATTIAFYSVAFPMLRARFRVAAAAAAAANAPTAEPTLRDTTAEIARGAATEATLYDAAAQRGSRGPTQPPT